MTPRDPAPESIDFIMEMGRALHMYGTAAYRLEQALETLARSLGMEIQVFSTPTAIIVGFRTAHGEEHRLLRIQPGEINLEKLSDVDELGDAVSAGKLSPSAGKEQIQRIMAKPSRYSSFLIAISFGLASAAISVFLSSGWKNTVTAGGIGLLIGLVTVGAPLLRQLGRASEAFSATVASFAAYLAASLIPEVSPQVVILAGLIVLVPGLTFTISMAELATQNLASGTARLMGTLMVFMKLFFGVFLGSKIAQMLTLTGGGLPDLTIPSWALWVALPFASLAFLVLFQARPKDFFWILVAGAVAMTASRWGSDLLGRELGAFSGGLAVGLASNLFARLAARPASVMLMPGIILLVPGSIGYRSLEMIYGSDVLGGVNQIFQMLFLAMALVAGLFFANVAITPRRSL